MRAVSHCTRAQRPIFTESKKVISASKVKRGLEGKKGGGVSLSCYRLDSARCTKASRLEVRMTGQDFDTYLSL